MLEKLKEVFDTIHNLFLYKEANVWLWDGLTGG